MGRLVGQGLLQVRIVWVVILGVSARLEWYLGGPLRTCPCSRRIALFPEQGDQPPLQERSLDRAFQTHVSQVCSFLGVATTSL
ncbi:hypothetical protein B0T20DRAFT_400008, partial [Sordaria brevicollis]